MRQRGWGCASLGAAYTSRTLRSALFGRARCGLPGRQAKRQLGSVPELAVRQCQRRHPSRFWPTPRLAQALFVRAPAWRLAMSPNRSLPLTYL